MTLSLKVAIGFMILGFLLALAGPLLFGDTGALMDSWGLPVLLGINFVVVFVLKLRERTRKSSRAPEKS